MSSNIRRVPLGPLENAKSASHNIMAQKAPRSSYPLRGLPTAGPSSKRSVTKRKRSQSAPSDDERDYHHHNHMPSSNNTTHRRDDTMHILKRRDSRASTPVDDVPSMPPYAPSVNDISTPSSKRQKTRTTTSSNIASVPLLRTSASRLKSIVTGKKRKHTEQYDVTPGPSYVAIYPTPRTPSLDLSVDSSTCSAHSEDNDPDDDLTFDIRATISDRDLIEQSKPVEERISTDVDNLNNLLRDACDKLSWSQKRLRQCENDKLAIEDSMQKNTDRWAKIAMDAMLERVRIQEECRRDLEIERIRRMKTKESYESEILRREIEQVREHSAQIMRHKVELSEAREATAAAKAHAHMLQNELNSSIMTVNSLEAEIHNGRYILAAAEEDLQEMASVKAQEAEEAVVKGLPPAYGDLEDEEYLAPWARHQDEGPLEVALVKHTTRKIFNDTLQKIMEKANAQRKSPDQEARKTAGVVLLRLLSAALSTICTQLKPVIDQAFFADRVAKLIIEFCWQIIAAFEIRPMPVIMDEVSRIAVDMNWRDVDNTLTEALEAAYRDKYPRTSSGEGERQSCCAQCKRAACSGYCVRLNELQTILEQLNALRSRLEALSPKHRFLMRTSGWAAAAVEVDLVFAAYAT